MRPVEHEPCGPAHSRSLGLKRRATIAALALTLAVAANASVPPPLPIALDRLQGLLQRFVDRTYRKAFRTLGDERDFDHGHFLFASDDPEAPPVAILYHTQELAYYQKPGSRFGFIDPEGRNWIQWIADGRLANAKLYERSAYPPTPSWDWFRAHELPALRRHRTILAEMLEPSAFGAQRLRSSQWVFKRSACRAPDEAIITVKLPSVGRVCLTVTK